MTRFETGELPLTPDKRSAMLTALTSRADAEAVAILRSLTTISSAEVATEAARALGELWTRFGSDLDRYRAELVGEVSDGGPPRSSLIEALAAEAREFFSEASAHALHPGEEITARWACLEIVTARPGAALALLDRALARACEEQERHELLALQERAWFASGDEPPAEGEGKSR